MMKPLIMITLIGITLVLASVSWAQDSNGSASDSSTSGSHHHHHRNSNGSSPN